MIVLNLACGHDHLFEGWFGSSHDFETQLTQDQLSCPICGDKQIRRMPTAARLNVSHLRAAAKGSASAQGQPGNSAPAPITGGAMPAQPVQPAQAGQSSEKPAWSEPPHPQALQQQMQALLLQAVREVVARTEDVGSQFAEEARRIHYGEAQDRGIRGQTSAEELDALADEGIEVMSLPLPPALTGMLQ
ncbi:DUF1178 family protein [Roseateles sp.]|uniref:DUF1178 family protein n=1 Tax=Roseateles sp. TaxID=1971397 RepID=UPI003BA802BC